MKSQDVTRLADKILIALSFLAFTVLLYSVFKYKSHQNHILDIATYYLLPGLCIVTPLTLLRIRPSIKINLVLLIIVSVVTIYAYEIALALESYIYLSTGDIKQLTLYMVKIRSY